MTDACRPQPAAALSRVHAALQYVQQLPEGTYLLRRSAGSSVVQCLRALPDAHAAGIEKLHDLTAERSSAGATDAENLDFVPIRWQARLVGLCAACDFGVPHSLCAMSRHHNLASSKFRSRTLPLDCLHCCLAVLLDKSGCFPEARRRHWPRRTQMVAADNPRRSGVREFATVTFLQRGGLAGPGSAAPSLI